tara:strand:- start:267 stop:836 length:570 start_codon:yes stop_codon:yes gene_type:complete
MKLTKSQLKQLIKEAFTNEMTDSQMIAQNRLDINDLYSETRRLRAEFEDSIDELTAKLYDSLSTGETPNRFASAPVVSAPPGRQAGPEETTMSEMKLTKSQLKQIIKKELEPLSEGGFAGHYEKPGWARRTLTRQAERERENTKPREAMRLLSQLRSYTTEEWSPKAAESFDELLILLQEMEEDLNINP